MIKAYVKSFLRTAFKILPLRFIPLDAALRFTQRISAVIARMLFVRDWQLEAQGRPQFFKHLSNMSTWPFAPMRWAFTARGVYARENMFKGSKVLDLCCGDGSYSYLFFSDIAGRIDAVDNDIQAITYARKYFSSSTTEHYQIDIVNQPLPSADYDFVVWNAAICYFDEFAIRRVLSKIVDAGKQSMKLTGMLPKANGWVDHKTEFSDSAEVERLLLKYFKTVSIKEVDEGTTITFYFQASSPLPTEPVL
ncbi:class I SAM-dependent methyltransferase [bacterium]|nr:class I SAM-dependent methyltransferase [bacterium]